VSLRVNPNETGVADPALPDFAVEVRLTVAGTPAVVNVTVV
jgi:hypothetical protein